MRNLLSTMSAVFVTWYFSREDKRAERLADRDFMRLFSTSVAFLGVSLAVRWFAHLEFFSGVCLGVGIALGVVADIARRLGLTNGAWKVKARS